MAHSKRTSGTLARWGPPLLGLLSFLAISLGLYMGLISAPSFPEEEFGGIAHRIMYIHIPFAINSFAAFFVGFAAAILYFWTDRLVYQHASRASVEVGFLFSIGVLLSGPLWARPVWGVWWSFSEPRLNSFLIMWAIFAVYFIIPPFLNVRRIRDRCRAAIAVVGFVTVPFVYYSVEMISAEQQLHPVNPEMEGVMTWAIRTVMLGLFLLFLAIAWVRFRQFKLHRWIYRKKTGLL